MANQGIFNQKKAPPPMAKPPAQLNDVVRRLRILEERYTNLRTRSQLTEQNILSKNRSFSTELKTIISDIHEIKREIEEMKNKILNLFKEIQTFASKEDVKILEKYISMWEPVNFVTQKEVEEIVKEAISKYMRPQ